MTICIAYPGKGRDGEQQDEEHRRQAEELEVVGEVPRPGGAHLLLGEQVVDVEHVPPPVRHALGRVHHGALRPGTCVKC